MRAGRHVVAHGERARALPEIVRRRQAPEKRARRDDEKLHRAFREARQRPEFLAPHLQRRRDLLIGRERRRRKERHALLAENARGVAREGRRIALVGEHDGPFQPERRAHGLEEVGQKAGGAPDRDTLPVDVPRTPASIRPERRCTAGAAASVSKKRNPSAASPGRIMAEAMARLGNPHFPARLRPQSSPEGTLVSLVPWLSLMRLDYCDECALPSV